MNYWDASALVPLLVRQSQSEALLRRYRADPTLFTWWATPTECLSACVRLHRERVLADDAFEAATARLRQLRTAWHEVLPGDAIRRQAERLLRVHPLRTADAFQLAAALAITRGQPESTVFVCLDARLVAAARREGFRL